jgi:hypothetical protein
LTKPSLLGWLFHPESLAYLAPEPWGEILSSSRPAETPEPVVSIVSRAGFKFRFGMQSGVSGIFPRMVLLALDKIADKLAIERNADPADEDIQRDAVFQAAADRARAEMSASAGFGGNHTS